MVVHRIRIELPDQPGVLAQLTSVIASNGGNVIGIDIHEHEPQRAVDDFIIEAPADWDVAAVAGQIERSGATLISAWIGARWRDPVVRALEWAAAMASVLPQDSELELSRTVGEVANASAAWVCTPAEAGAHEVGQAALDEGRPVVVLTDHVPAGMEVEGATDFCLLAVPDAELLPTMVAFVARPAAERFTASEIARIAALLKLFRSMMPSTVS